MYTTIETHSTHKSRGGLPTPARLTLHRPLKGHALCTHSPQTPRTWTHNGNYSVTLRQHHRLPAPPLPPVMGQSQPCWAPHPPSWLLGCDLISLIYRSCSKRPCPSFLTCPHARPPPFVSQQPALLGWGRSGRRIRRDRQRSWVLG